MNLSVFPQYTKFDPQVPVYCITPAEGRVIHRYFTTSPFSPSGRYLAAFRLPYEDHPPRPGDRGQVIVIDLETGREQVVATSGGWEMQVGANINWGIDDDTLIFNDVNADNWTVHGVKLHISTGEQEHFEHGVYHVSSDGHYALVGNLITERRTQTGYGVVIPDELVPKFVGLNGEDGLWVTNLDTMETKMLISIKEAVERTASPEQLRDFERFEHYIFHSNWSPDGRRIMFSIRRYPHEEPGRFNMIAGGEMYFDVYTINADGTGLHNALDSEVWRNYGHHTAWEPDSTHLSLNLAIDGGQQVKFCEVNYDGRNLHRLFDNPVGSGHPQIHPSGKFLVTDVYMFEPLCNEDGTSPLRFIDLGSRQETDFVRIGVRPPTENVKRFIELRLDPHPAWDRTWRYLAFNAIEGGTRRIFIADMKPLMGKAGLQTGRPYTQTSNR